MKMFKRTAQANTKTKVENKLEAPIVLTPDQLEILAVCGAGAGEGAGEGSTTRGGAVQHIAISARG